MLNFRPILLSSLLLMLSACSDDRGVPPPAAKRDNPLSAQTEALDKARQLESQIQDAAQQQRQRIDEESR